MTLGIEKYGVCGCVKVRPLLLCVPSLDAEAALDAPFVTRGIFLCDLGDPVQYRVSS